MKAISKFIISLLWILVTTGVNAQGDSNKRIHLEINDMLGNIDGVSIYTLGGANNNQEIVLIKQGKTNIFSGDISVSSNNWMTGLIIETMSENKLKKEQLYININKYGVDFKIPIYHYDNLSEFKTGNLSDTLLNIENNTPDKPLERRNISLAQKNNPFEKLLRSYFQAKFLCQNDIGPSYPATKLRACRAYFDSAYRLADLVGFNKLFSMDPYVMEHWEEEGFSYHEKFKNDKNYMKNKNYMKPMLIALPTNSIFYYCDFTQESASSAVYDEYLKQEFKKLTLEQQRYLQSYGQRCERFD